MPLAVAAAASSAITVYLGWVCSRCLAVDAKDGLLDVISVHLTREDAEMELLSEEYWASLEWAAGE